MVNSWPSRKALPLWTYKIVLQDSASKTSFSSTCAGQSHNGHQRCRQSGTSICSSLHRTLRKVQCIQTLAGNSEGGIMDTTVTVLVFWRRIIRAAPLITQKWVQIQVLQPTGTGTPGKKQKLKLFKTAFLLATHAKTGCRLPYDQ